jgi:hypothetical protein
VSSPPFEEEFFDPELLSELEGLAATPREAIGASTPASALPVKLAQFLAVAGEATRARITEDDFVAAPNPQIIERTNTLIEICREAGASPAVQGIESFVVFFQALVPSLSPEGAGNIRRFFFRLAPTLIHIAYNDFGSRPSDREDGLAALRNLESILIEISSVRLAPSESELVFRSVDQMSEFIAVGEYAMANEIIASRLLSIIERNKLTRALYRLMEVEVAIQVYLKERLGRSTPQIRLPEDYELLSDYGPIRIMREEQLDGASKRYIQVQLPHIESLKDVTLHLAPDGGGPGHDLRLDALGSAMLDLPDGTYSLGLIFQPEEGRRG